MAKDPKQEAKEELDVALKDIEEAKPDEKETPEEAPKEDKETPEAEPEEGKEDVQEDEKPPIDYKKKFSESSREAQRIASENKKINEVIDQARVIPDPTEEEMKKEYPEWDVMEDHSRRTAIQATKARVFQENLMKARGEGKKLEKWHEKVDKFVEDPEVLIKHPELEGKADEFRIYANDAPNTKFDILVAGFLYNAKQSQVKHKGQMMPKGSAGDKTAVKPDGKISLEEGRKLRETDYNKWREFVKQNKIRSDF